MSYKIVGEKGIEKEKNNTIYIIAAVISALVLGLGTIFYFSNSKPKDYDQYLEKKLLYDDKNINYTYDDFKKDKEVEEKLKDKQDENVNSKENSAGLSNATKQLLDTNSQLLKDMKEETMIDADVYQVQTDIIEQTKKFKEHLDSNLGWPDSKYNDKQYGVAKQYIKAVVASIQGKTQLKRTMYKNSVEEELAIARYSVSELVQFNTGNSYTAYYSILKNYLLLGAPQITYINGINLSKSDKEFDQGLKSNIQADITTDAGNFRVYLVSNVQDDGLQTFKILDMEAM